MNVERLRKVVEAIAAHPQAFNMELWHCDTEACLAGHAVDLMAKEQGQTVVPVLRDDGKWTSLCRIGDGPQSSWREIAKGYFEIDSDQADRLFDTSEWPNAHEDAYENAAELDDRIGMIEALRARVEAFIAKNGHEPAREY